MITIYNIVVYDEGHNPVNFLKTVNLMEDDIRISIGWVNPQTLFDIYRQKFLDKYGEKWDYTSAVFAADVGD